MARKSKGFEKYLTQNNIILFLLASVVFIILLVMVIRVVGSPDGNAPISEGQIMIQKGGNTIIVNKNGLVEYRSGDEVFYKRWDSSKISYFFERMEQKAREYIENGTEGQCNGCEGSGCYTVTLYIDGELVTICVVEDEDLDSEFEDFEDDELGEVDLSDFYDEEDDENGQGSGTLTPTQTPVGGGNPTPTPQEENGQQTNYPPVDTGCSAWTEEIVDKAVITNTLCTKEPTPTP
jgi:hypothetical protein